MTTTEFQSQKPRTVWAAVALIVVLCLVAEVLPLSKDVYMPHYLSFALFVLIWFSVMVREVLAGHRWGRWLVVLSAMASLALLPIPGWLCLIAIVPLAGSAILLHLPPSARWFAQAAYTVAAQPVPAWRKMLRAGVMTLITVPAVFGAWIGSLALTGFLSDIPGNWKYRRLCSYPDKDVLLAAEPDEVAKVVEFEQGRNYTAFVFPPIGFMHYGPAVFVYDENEHRVDCCKDVHENPDFLKRWRSLRYRLRGLTPPPLTHTEKQTPICPMPPLTLRQSFPMAFPIAFQQRAQRRAPQTWGSRRCAHDGHLSHSDPQGICRVFPTLPLPQSEKSSQCAQRRMPHIRGIRRCARWMAKEEAFGTHCRSVSEGIGQIGVSLSCPPTNGATP